MVRSESWLLWGLLGLICLLPVWVASAEDKCKALKSIKEELNSTLRRRYMKQNFPINYTIQVHYEEVFRLRNISRLMNESDPSDIKYLQKLWLDVAMSSIKKILRVLPERHPTRTRYLTNLEELFKMSEQLLIDNLQEDDFPESIWNILERLKDPNYKGWRSVTPKSLLDNCYRTMHCLFRPCFQREGADDDYCNILHWRKRNGTTPQPT
ncbi:interleukin-34 [Hoplias malabaricus]|uniref:interleukin-34 n=1 Tax=Hoplias malabaricus TaxID=27720 RepID=UPI003461EE6C